MTSSPNYKYNEGALIQELQSYIDETYGQHYSQNKYQATEFIIDGGHGMGFCIGNILKYAQRYGKKDGTNRKDLLKVLHYAIIALHVHDIGEQEAEEEQVRQYEQFEGDIAEETSVDGYAEDDIPF
tara:strand:- start:2349 stop:2726 length:378 start_codon:yes stop_codon:yes gene_type:complete